MFVLLDLNPFHVWKGSDASAQRRYLSFTRLYWLLGRRHEVLVRPFNGRSVHIFSESFLTSCSASSPRKEAEISFVMFQWLKMIDVACGSVIPDEGIAGIDTVPRSMTKIMNWFLVVDFGSGLNISRAICSQSPLANTSFRCRFLLPQMWVQPETKHLLIVVHTVVVMCFQYISRPMR